MSHQDSGNAWVPGEVALQEARSSWAAGISSDAGELGADLSKPDVLARLPDLGAVASPEEAKPKAGRFDGRLLSHAFSTKLLVGAGLLLLLAAVLPLVLKKSEPKPGTPPAPDAEEAAPWNGRSAETSNALPASPSVSYEPEMSFSPDLPPAPDFLKAGQPTDPVPSRGEPPAEDATRDGAAVNPSQAPFSEHPSRRDLGQPGARANQSMTIGDAMPRPTGIYAGDYRHDDQADPQANLPTHYSDRSIPRQAIEPGVARLEGVIEKPSVRTSYDAGRSSVH